MRMLGEGFEGEELVAVVFTLFVAGGDFAWLIASWTSFPFVLRILVVQRYIE